MRTNSVTLPNWPNLNYVSLPACKLAMDWSRGQMRNLSTIYMTSFGDNIDWDYFTHFCCNLALHPEAIPQLTTLSLAQSPEWDILFILLERYNFRTAADNKMLKSLTLGDTPPDLRKPLQMLCGGKFTDRPPNIELSWIGNVDIIFDESLPGCLECHKLLLFCKYTTAPNRHLAWGLSSSSSSSSSSLDLPVDILGERSDSPLGISRMFGDIPKIEDLYIPTYPDNPQDVLLQWEQRENAWQSLQDFGRLRSCQKAGRSQVHISDSYCPNGEWIDVD
ncbi:hypothetical protein FRC17_000850 [Serendipita sp. 399]|nr:hypothetical protein FRC17_000850 [Serendipita sp. 399]